MKALYTNDKVKGPGHGFLEISDLPQIGSLEGAAFIIKRASDQRSLGKSGWQPAETLLTPAGLVLGDDGYALSVGPDVVDWPDTQETYRLILKCADGTSAQSTLRVPEVAYSPKEGGQGIAGARTPAPPEKPAPPPAEPAPVPVEESKEETVPPEPAPEVEEPPAPPPAQAGKKSSSLPLVLVLLALLLGGGGFAVWKFVLNKEEAPPARPPLNIAREHLSGAADPTESMRLAKELRALENGADAAFLLAEDAAGKNNAEAMLMTGAFYDPADKEPSGSIIKDAAQALAWYLKAKAAGNTGADARVDALRAWAEAEAQKGNQAAKDLLPKF